MFQHRGIILILKIVKFINTKYELLVQTLLPALFHPADSNELEHYYVINKPPP